MFAYIKGTLEEIEPKRVVLDVNGVGYQMTVPTSLIPKLPSKGETVKLYAYLNVREDIQELYGFFDHEEKSLFEKLISVSGIGPKGAVAILSTLTPRQIAMAIATGDLNTLCTAPGVGKKTSQRLVLELKEKINKESFLKSRVDSSEEFIDNSMEVIQALLALGYQINESRQAFESIEERNQDTSALIKQALKILDKR